MPENETALQLIPSSTRILKVRHLNWELDWRLQFPETLACAAGWFLDYPELAVTWQPIGGTGWEYRRCLDAEHETWMRKQAALDVTGKLAQKPRLIGMELRASVVAEQDQLRLTLEITNTGKHTWVGVVSDGGCFQAHNAEFAGDQEPNRTCLMAQGQMHSLGDVPRSMPIRSMYHSNPQHSRRLPWAEGGWFWGESSFVPDVPCVIGMRSRSGDKAVVLGFECAETASANADDHHCMHSSPSFGTILPDQTVRRMGIIKFGTVLEKLAQEVRAQLTG